MQQSENHETEQLLVGLHKTNAESVASNTHGKEKINDLQSTIEQH